MKSLNESVALSMDCDSLELVPYLPYILQDFHEMGSNAKSILKIINTLKPNRKIELLDLGCGKGAVTCFIAQNTNSICLGIDAVKEFIDYAIDYKNKNSISNCNFIVGDIRNVSNVGNKYDFIILGSVGPVFENYTIGMELLKPILKDDGYILLDDAYMENGKVHHITLSKEELFFQITNGGMQIEKEFKGKDICVEDEFDGQIEKIKERCNQLIKDNPEKESMFRNFIEKQEKEYGNLRYEITCSTLAIRKMK